MVNRNRKSYADAYEITGVRECYTDGELHGWIVKSGDVRPYVGLPWLERFLIETSKPQSFFKKLLSKIGYKRNNGYTNNNVHIKPVAKYLKENPGNVPDRIADLLAKHPELVLIPLTVLFPSMLNIPVIKMLMVRKFSL